jgi:hypothetical protein
MKHYSETYNTNVVFADLMAETMKSTIFCIMKPFSLKTARYFEVYIIFIFSLLPTSDGFLLSLLFSPEDLGNKFLQNVKASSNYTALKAKRPCSKTVFHNQCVMAHRCTLNF